MPDGGLTVWSVFPKNTRYFGPSRKPFMFNLVEGPIKRKGAS